MKGFIKSKKGVAALLATMVVVGASAFGAYAYFTNTGSQSSGTAVLVGGTLTGTFTVAFPATDSYSYPNSGGAGCTAGPTPAALFPTAAASCNAVREAVPWTITNNSEATENVHTYTVSILSSWEACPAGYTATPGGAPASDTCVGTGGYNGDPVCSAADFSVNGLAVSGADTETGTFAGSSSNGVVDPALDNQLNPNSDGVAGGDQMGGTATIEMINALTRNQDGCQGVNPPITVSVG